MTVFRPAQLTKYRAAFQQSGARTVQKQARQSSQSGVRQEFSKPKDYQMSRAINEVSRSFSYQDIVFTRTNARTVQKRARQGSRSDARQEFSKPNDNLLSRNKRSIAQLFESRFCICPNKRPDCSKASETRLARV